MDRHCMTCGEPWDIEMEPDAPITEVEAWLLKEYGDGFEIRGLDGDWIIEGCPSCQSERVRKKHPGGILRERVAAGEDGDG